VREAPFLGIPSLDVGTRQVRRTTAPSVMACGAHEDGRIQAFLAREWQRRYPACEAFGRGQAAAQFSEILATPAFWSRPLQKTFTDRP